MTFSTSSSASRRMLVLLAGVLAAQSTGAMAADAADVVPRLGMVALFPVENLTGTQAPVRAILPVLEAELARRGVDVVAGERLAAFLARHRVRYTGGLDAEVARAAREELGVDAVLLTSWLTRQEGPPRSAFSMRLVSTDPEPKVLWMGGSALSGDQSPGLFNLGLEGDPRIVQARALGAILDDLASFVWSKAPPASACNVAGWYQPRSSYSAPIDLREPRTVLVLPFVNFVGRRGAGEVVANEFARQFLARPEFRLVEPGLVRKKLLDERVVMENGVSLDQARTVAHALQGELVLAGYVFAFDDSSGIPQVNVTAMLIERRTGRVVWESTSYNGGDDGGTVFGLNRVRTATDLACRMMSSVVDQLVRRARASRG